MAWQILQAGEARSLLKNLHHLHSSAGGSSGSQHCIALLGDSNASRGMSGAGGTSGADAWRREQAAVTWPAQGEAAVHAEPFTQVDAALVSRPPTRLIQVLFVHEHHSVQAAPHTAPRQRHQPGGQQLPQGEGDGRGEAQRLEVQAGQAPNTAALPGCTEQGQGGGEHGRGVNASTVRCAGVASQRHIDRTVELRRRFRAPCLRCPTAPL